MSGTIKLDDAPEWAQRKRQEVLKATILGLQSAAARLVTHIQTNIIPNTKVGGRAAPPVDNGGYRAGWRFKPIPRGAVITHIDQKMAAIMEHGIDAANVKIGQKMLTALARWAVRKGLTGDPQEAVSIAWAIAKTFEKDGMEGRRVLERAMADAPAFIQEEVQHELQRVAKS